MVAHRILNPARLPIPPYPHMCRPLNVCAAFDCYIISGIIIIFKFFAFGATKNKKKLAFLQVICYHIICYRVKKEVRHMAKCEYCGKDVSFGIKVSHSHRRSNRTWKPNIKRVKAIVNGSPKRVYACTRCLRSGKVTRAVWWPNRYSRHCFKRCRNFFAFLYSRSGIFSGGRNTIIYYAVFSNCWQSLWHNCKLWKKVLIFGTNGFRI